MAIVDAVLRKYASRGASAEVEHITFGDVDKTALEKYVKSQEKAYLRMRDRGKDGDKKYKDFASWTDEDCRTNAERLGRTYEDQFRTRIVKKIK